MSSIPFLAAEALTASAIPLIAKDNAGKLAAAQTAAQVAAFFTAAGKGDFTGANAQLSTFIANIKDPGLGQLAADLWSTGQPFIQAEEQVLQNIPVLGGSLQQALADAGAGIASVAGAYIGKLTAK